MAKIVSNQTLMLVIGVAAGTLLAGFIGGMINKK